MKFTIKELVESGWQIVEVIDENEVVWKRENWLMQYDIKTEEVLDVRYEHLIPINLN